MATGKARFAQSLIPQTCGQTLSRICSTLTASKATKILLNYPSPSVPLCYPFTDVAIRAHSRTSFLVTVTELSPARLNSGAATTNDQLFAALIEVIYALRNALLHGELQPHGQAFTAYEHAYRIVMRFLGCLQG
jgi:hypothetical protein